MNWLPRVGSKGTDSGVSLCFIGSLVCGAEAIVDPRHLRWFALFLEKLLKSELAVTALLEKNPFAAVAERVDALPRRRQNRSSGAPAS